MTEIMHYSKGVAYLAKKAMLPDLGWALWIFVMTLRAVCADSKHFCRLATESMHRWIRSELMAKQKLSSALKKI